MIFSLSFGAAPLTAGSFVVVDPIARLYAKIPADIPPTTTQLYYGQESPDQDGLPPALIYGNVVEGRPSAGNPGWIELARPLKDGLRYLPAHALEREPRFATTPGRLLIGAPTASVYVMPDRQSRCVIMLLKGEVVPLTGETVMTSGGWYRALFRSGPADGFETFNGPIGERVGWVSTADAKPLDPLLDQARVESSEIPEMERACTEIYDRPARSRLADQGCYVSAGPVQEHLRIDDLIDAAQDTDGPRFITSDLFLHATHLIFDRMLQNIEEDRLLPTVRELTGKMLAATTAQARASSDPLIRQAAWRNVRYFGTAAILFGMKPDLPIEIRAEAGQEAGRMVSAGEVTEQPSKWMPGFAEDYSQYKPRGHYTLNEDLQSYFRGMQFLGRTTFSNRYDSPVLSMVLLSLCLRRQGLEPQWRAVSDAITLLVGETDDWTPLNCLGLLATLGVDASSEAGLVRTLRLPEFRSEAGKRLPPKRIVDQGTSGRIGFRPQLERVDLVQGYRFMGQRVTPDAEWFQRLTSPSVGTNLNPRNMPSSLDVGALLGSPVAIAQALARWSTIAGYAKALRGLAKSPMQPGGSPEVVPLYREWLAMLGTLFAPSGSRQYFVAKPSWGDKTLNSVLGSWIELKHDTVLYGEQSYAEMGSGGDDFAVAAAFAPPVVKGYVEPNPKFFRALERMADSAQSLLGKGDVLPDQYASKLNRLAELSDRAAVIAEKEISGTELQDSDFAMIDGLPGQFDARLIFPEGGGEHWNEDHLRMALVADVATDNVAKAVLEVAIGRPRRLTVFVKDYWGGSRVARGVVYSTYEFASAKRWSDEEWKTLVYQQPDQLKDKEPTWFEHWRLSAR